MHYQNITNIIIVQKLHLSYSSLYMDQISWQWVSDLSLWEGFQEYLCLLISYEIRNFGTGVSRWTFWSELLSENDDILWRNSDRLHRVLSRSQGKKKKIRSSKVTESGYQIKRTKEMLGADHRNETETEKDEWLCIVQQDKLLSHQGNKNIRGIPVSIETLII